MRSYMHTHECMNALTHVCMYACMHTRRFPEDWGSLYAAEVALGLDHIHKNGYLYRDLKLENVSTCAHMQSRVPIHVHKGLKLCGHRHLSPPHV